MDHVQYRYTKPPQGRTRPDPSLACLTPIDPVQNDPQVLEPSHPAPTATHPVHIRQSPMPPARRIRTSLHAVRWGRASGQLCVSRGYPLGSVRPAAVRSAVPGLRGCGSPLAVCHQPKLLAYQRPSRSQRASAWMGKSPSSKPATTSSRTCAPKTANEPKALTIGHWPGRRATSMWATRASNPWTLLTASPYQCAKRCAQLGKLFKCPVAFGKPSLCSVHTPLIKLTLFVRGDGVVRDADVRHVICR